MDYDAPNREFADRGIVWLLESRENLRGLMQLTAGWLADSLDFTCAAQLNRSFMPDDPRRAGAGIVFRVQLRNRDGEVWI